MSVKELKTYESLIEKNPKVERILTPEMAQRMFDNNDFTIESLSGLWRDNLHKNIALYKKHGSFIDAFQGFGVNKAVIAVGAGPSFNLNKQLLKEIYEWNLQFPLEHQPFIIIASNKQFKPLLDMGICPHFVILIDGGSALYPQLCEGIPKRYRDSFLIAGLHTSNKILKQWDKQGGQICFYAIGDDEEKTYFKKKTGDDAERIHISQGGNVLNTLWILSQNVLGSAVYITVGNDLAFKYSKNKEERANSFYADGDYRLNILNKRDEAKDQLAWMGFELNESIILPERVLCDFKLMGTSRQLWIYKTWLEVQAGVFADQHSFHIYNCSESGILGVLARENSPKAMMEKENWYLIDEVFPNRWHTRTLKQARNHFLEARRCLMDTQAGNGAGFVAPLPQVTDFVSGIGQLTLN